MKKKKIFQKILADDFDFSGNVFIDSNLVGSGDIFFAIRNGNNYVEQAIANGAYPIYDRELNVNAGKKVDDTITFMQDFARKYRKHLDAKVIAVTGSNGKTTVKDILANLLDNSYATKGNYNNHIGVPLTILSCPITSKYLVLELGMSMTGEIDLLASISKPDYSIITNIGDSHIEYLKTRENVFLAKTEIIAHTKNTVIVNGEDEYLKRLDNAVKVTLNTDVNIDDNGTSFEYKNIKYHTNLYGKHNVLDICLCLEVLHALKIDNIANKLDNIKLTPMRFEIIKKDSNIIINDAYNAAPKSVESSLLTLDQIFKGKNKIIILGDMLELGEQEIEHHKNLAKVLEKIKYDKIYLYGDLMKHLNVDKAIHTNDKQYIKSELQNITNSVVFLKGSRGMKLEDILKGDK